MGQQLIIYIDGGSRGNPGPAATGVHITDGQTGQTLHQAGYYLGKATNNVAEYNGLLKALDLAHSLGGQDVRIYSDSELMVKQITGEYRVKSAELKPLFEKAQMMLLRLPTWQIRHVRREKNTVADAMVNQALDAKRDVVASGDAPGPSASKTPGAQKKAPKPAATEQPLGEQWFTAKLTSEPGRRCPARTPAEKVFAFGPSTPEGFCVYAAQAVLSNGPLGWSDGSRTSAQLRCPHCRASVAVELESE